MVTRYLPQQAISPGLPLFSLQAGGEFLQLARNSRIRGLNGRCDPSERTSWRRCIEKTASRSPVDWWQSERPRESEAPEILLESPTCSHRGCVQGEHRRPE